MEFIRNVVNLYHLLSVFNIEADLLCLLSSSTGAVIATIEALFAVTKYGIFFFAQSEWRFTSHNSIVYLRPICAGSQHNTT